MTELFIDGYPVSLPEDFEIDYYMYNPFFTRKGEYTYDIDIDLRDKENAKIYKHIDRLHVGKKPTGRRAILIADAKVIVSGTEVILGFDEYHVKFQIVAGNSELNYLTGGEANIRKLDFGEMVVTREIALQTLDGYFPEFNFVCPPVYTGFANNEFKFDNQMKVTQNNTSYIDDTTLSPQPYLLYYVERLVELLGYKMKRNYLRDIPKWARLFLVNGNQTLKYAEMLPNWSIDKFIGEIEKFFNCVFVVNQMTKCVNIYHVSSFYADKEVVYIPECLKQIEKKFDQDQNLYLNYTNVSYKFPSQNEYKYDCPDKEIIDSCSVIQVSNYFDVWNYRRVNYDQLKIYHSADYDLDFVPIKSPRYGISEFRQRVFNRFSAIMNDTDDSATELEIIPAEIYAGVTGIGELMTQGGFTAPFTRNVINSEKDDTKQGFTDIILNGIPEEEAPSHLFVAIYLGWNGVYIDGGKPDYQYKEYRLPMSATDVFYYINGNEFDNLIKHQDASLTLVLKGDNGLYNTTYKNELRVDTETENVINFLSEQIHDPKSFFVVANKRFYCEQLHYKIRAEGVSQEAEGTFYPM